MKHFSARVMHYLCCFIFIASIPGHVSANSKSVEQFEAVLNAFAVEGVSLGMKQSEFDAIMQSAGYTLKKQASKRNVLYRYMLRKDKRPYQIRISTPLDHDVTDYIKATLPMLDGTASLDSEKQRIHKAFAGHEKTCELRKTYLRCRNFTDTNKLFIEVRSAGKNIQYILQNIPDDEARSLAEQRAHSQAHKVNTEAAAEKQQQTPEQQADKPAAASVQQKEAKKKKAQESKLKEEAKLKAEQKSMQEQQAGQEKERLARFLQNEDIAGHPCSEYDVNNKKQAMACLQALDARIEIDRHLPDIWLKRGTCYYMKENLREHLQSMGFWESAIKDRTPDCKMFADLYEEKFGTDVYWSKCVEGPKDDPQYVFDCLNFGKAISLHESPDRYPFTYRNNLEGAGFDVGVEGEHRYQRDFWKPVVMLVQQERSKSLARMEEQLQESLYEFYYEETPERARTKYSAAERKMMTDLKLKVPSSYAAPTAEEIRLAVMRSIVNRANGGEGGDPDNSYIEAMKREKKATVAVVTDGYSIYLPRGVPASVGMHIEFGEPQNARCSKRNDGQGYMCQYILNTQADMDRYSKARMGAQDMFSGPGNTIANLSVQFMSRVENYHNWFILTEAGWRQPHTGQEMSEIRDHETSTTQSIQQQNNQQGEDTSMVGGALQDLQGGFRSQGAGAGMALRRLW